MALHHDLLEQAAHLAKREKHKPRQASLRRAVSASYYALFDLLISDGARLLSPVKPAGLKLRIRRTFAHADTLTVCKQFARGTISPATRGLLSLPLDGLLVSVLDAFVELQEARHAADYDLATNWKRLDVLRRVQKANWAFANWAKVRGTENASVFLAAMLFQKSWGT